MIVCDTGPLVALSNERDEHYVTANNLFRDLHMAGETLLLPSTVLAETCSWMNEHGGPEVEAAFLDAVVDGTFKLVDLTSPLRLKTPTVTPPHRKPAINLLARSGPRS